MIKNGLKNRPALKSANFPYTPPAKSTTTPRSSPIAVASWGFLIVFGVWMFILGVVVGRYTTPIDVDPPAVDTELAALQAREADSRKTSPPDQPVGASETQLEFYDVLKRPPNTDLSTDGDRPSETENGKTASLDRTAKEERAKPPGKATYAIQVASFSVQEDADRLVAVLKQKGYAGAHRSDDTIEGIGARYRVKIGSFDSRSQAVGALEQLKAKERFKDAYIFQQP